MDLLEVVVSSPLVHNATRLSQPAVLACEMITEGGQRISLCKMSHSFAEKDLSIKKVLK